MKLSASAKARADRSAANEADLDRPRLRMNGGRIDDARRQRSRLHIASACGGRFPRNESRSIFWICSCVPPWNIPWIFWPRAGKIFAPVSRRRFVVGVDYSAPAMGCQRHASDQIVPSQVSSRSVRWHNGRAPRLLAMPSAGHYRFARTKSQTAETEINSRENDHGADRSAGRRQDCVRAQARIHRQYKCAEADERRRISSNSLRDDREIYIYGERVKDVTTHPAFRNTARMVARLYDAMHDPKHMKKLMVPTDTGNGGMTQGVFQVAEERRGIGCRA